MATRSTVLRRQQSQVVVTLARVRRCNYQNYHQQHQHHVRYLSTTIYNQSNVFARKQQQREQQTQASSSSSSDEDEPPAKNMGTVVGAWVFCRHGDRTPSRPLCPPHRVDDEAHFWLTKLPYPSTAAAYKELCASFPPLIDDPTGHFMDVHRNPYGFVTHKGLLQMQHNGRLLRQRYDPFVHNDNDNNYDVEDRDLFLKNWRISAYSTNYLRTVLSVQSFLDGLLHTNIYQPTSTRDDMDFTKMRAKEWPVPDHNFIPTPVTDDDMDSSDDDDEPDTTADGDEEEEEEFRREGYGSDWEADPRNNPLNLYLSKQAAKQQKARLRKSPKVFVRVRDQSCDNLNAFDRNPDLMRDLVSDVMQSPSFQQTDMTAAPIAARLANILPGLARKGRKDFSASTPSGINWVEAADHFVCRTAHNLPLSTFSDFEHDDNVEQILSAMTYKALGHLAWRFRQWYQNPQLLAAIAAPPLREIAQQLDHLIVSSSSSRSSKSSTSLRALQDPHENFLCIYSCHDVTLLSLLYALGADFLADEQSAVWREYWPEYASTLVIELVRLDNDDVADNRIKENHDPENDDDDDRHVMRVMINGRLVISTDFLLTKFQRDKNKTIITKWDEDNIQTLPPANLLGKGPQNLLTIGDFWNIITQLESVGEYDFSRWPAMKKEERGKQKTRTRGSLNSSLN